MKLNLKWGILTLALVAALATAVGMGYAALKEVFDVPITGIVTVTKLETAAEAADVSGDGVVDITDLVIVARGIAGGQSPDVRADVDNSGLADVFDLAFVARHFNPPVPTPTAPTVPTPTSTTIPASISPSNGNTLIEDVSGSVSNGAGDWFSVGKTNMATILRGVIGFDVARTIPGYLGIRSLNFWSLRTYRIWD